MRILIVSQYLGNLEKIESNCSRFLDIARYLDKENQHDIEILTSDFNHSTKEHFKKINNKSNFKITMIREPGYKKNISIKRAISHKILSSNMKKYLKKIIIPDCVYCAVPSLSVASVMANYCKKNKAKFIIDIQDLWPESFKIAFNIPILSDILFYPLKYKANKIYSMANEIVAVSNTFGKRALQVNKKINNYTSVFLGKEIDLYDRFKQDKPLIEKKPTSVWLGYCGTLGYSYDLITVMKALIYMKENNLITPTFVIMGDGPRYKEFETFAINNDIDAVFTGKLAYYEMCPLLDLCDIVVNPIVSTSVASIINKHADYAISGKPVINTQNSEEYRNLIKEYNMGFNVNAGDYIGMANCIYKLMENPNLIMEQGLNARKCGETLFDRKKTYAKIITLIKNK